MTEAHGKIFKGTLEVVGVGAVLVGLVFVGVELRQNTASVQAATSQGLLEMANQSGYSVATDPELAEFLFHADKSLDGLSGVERFRYRNFVQSEFNIWEQAFYVHADGTLDDRLWDGYDNSYRTYFCEPSPRVIWREIEKHFGAEFRAHVDGWTSDACAEQFEMD